LSIAKVNLVDFLLHTLDLEQKVLVDRQTALIIENLENQENVEHAQDEKKDPLLAMNHDLPFQMKTLRCNSPRFSVAFEFAQCKIQNVFDPLRILRTDDGIDASEKGFVGMQALAVGLDQNDIDVPAPKSVPLSDNCKDRFGLLRLL
jgi:hypothetical protein